MTAHLDRACEVLWQAGHPAIAEALEREVRELEASRQRLEAVLWPAPSEPEAPEAYGDSRPRPASGSLGAETAPADGGMCVCGHGKGAHLHGIPGTVGECLNRAACGCERFRRVGAETAPVEDRVALQREGAGSGKDSRSSLPVAPDGPEVLADAALIREALAGFKPGSPDPGSFGGHDYSENERALGYGTDHDPRFGPFVSVREFDRDRALAALDRLVAALADAERDAVFYRDLYERVAALPGTADARSSQERSTRAETGELWCDTDIGAKRRGH